MNSDEDETATAHRQQGRKPSVVVTVGQLRLTFCWNVFQLRCPRQGSRRAARTGEEVSELVRVDVVASFARRTITCNPDAVTSPRRHNRNAGLSLTANGWLTCARSYRQSAVRVLSPKGSVRGLRPCRDQDGVSAKAMASMSSGVFSPMRGTGIGEKPDDRVVPPSLER